MNFRFALASVCLSAALLATGAPAQTAPQPAPAGPPTVTGPSKIAMINIQDAILSTAEGKKLNAAMQARFAPRSTDLTNQKNEITALQNQLDAGGNTMSTDAKATLTQEITTKTRDYQQSVTNAQTDFQDAQTELMNTVGNKMMPILKTYAEAHGYTAVIDISLPWPQSPVLYYNPGTVITSDIVKLYDAAHPVAAATSTAKPAPSTAKPPAGK